MWHLTKKKTEKLAIMHKNYKICMYIRSTKNKKPFLKKNHQRD